MSIAEILDDLDYGPAPESDAEARAWLTATRTARSSISAENGGSRSRAASSTPSTRPQGPCWLGWLTQVALTWMTP